MGRKRFTRDRHLVKSWAILFSSQCHTNFYLHPFWCQPTIDSHVSQWFFHLRLQAIICMDSLFLFPIHYSFNFVLRSRTFTEGAAEFLDIGKSTIHLLGLRVLPHVRNLLISFNALTNSLKLFPKAKAAAGESPISQLRTYLFLQTTQNLCFTGRHNYSWEFEKCRIAGLIWNFVFFVKYDKSDCLSHHLFRF
jgi:hypothetical protein